MLANGVSCVVTTNFDFLPAVPAFCEEFLSMLFSVTALFAGTLLSVSIVVDATAPSVDTVRKSVHGIHQGCRHRHRYYLYYNREAEDSSTEWFHVMYYVLDEEEVEEEESGGKYPI